MKQGKTIGGAGRAARSIVRHPVRSLLLAGIVACISCLVVSPCDASVHCLPLIECCNCKDGMSSSGHVTKDAALMLLRFIPMYSLLPSFRLESPLRAILPVATFMLILAGTVSRLVIISGSCLRSGRL